MAYLLSRRGGVFRNPLGLVLEDDGDLGLDQLGAQQALVSKLVEVGTQLAHIAEDLGSRGPREEPSKSATSLAPALDWRHWK